MILPACVKQKRPFQPRNKTKSPAEAGLFVLLNNPET
jgi:hypothetical protein